MEAYSRPHSGSKPESAQLCPIAKWGSAGVPSSLLADTRSLYDSRVVESVFECIRAGTRWRKTPRLLGDPNSSVCFHQTVPFSALASMGRPHLNQQLTGSEKKGVFTFR